ncbi:putative esterase [Labilithrix luteola]|uniref:Putative esterase n=1 Tax=Labilithrix luteola TaxID=1391654 RepID=A0A0K1PLC0_9BACT|nr:alpha/beta hydrolase-fold protein [Labilithrix luteola]AKU93914.1 putative esterase [Labilithrix luteola]
MSLRTMLDFFGRVVVRPNVDLTAAEATIDFEMHAPAGEIVVMAVLDRGHDFISAMFGGGADGNLQGRSEKAQTITVGRPTAVDVALSRIHHAPPPGEQCQGERFRLETVTAPKVAGSMGNPTTRRLCVHLPPSYDAEPSRRYPVLYAFAGLMGSDTSGTILDVMKATDTIGSGAREAIVVGVDVRTNYGSSYLENTALAGDFDSFVSSDVVAQIDRTYRTLASPDKRGVVGQSTGGFNVVSLGLRHSDVFQTIVASSPDGLDFGEWLLEPDGKHVRPRWLAWMRVEDQAGPPGQMTSYAADWSPEPGGHHGLAWPADLTTGVVVPETWARWKRHSPTTLLADPTILANAKARLAGRILLAAGRNDEADLFAPTQRFSDALRRAGIDHTFAPDDGGHFIPPARMTTMVDFALRSLSSKK